MLAIVIGVVLFLVAAKLHGRQLRLEREFAGYHEVTFGRGANNPPFVVALWRRERFIFWPIAFALAGALHFSSLTRPLAYVFVPTITAFLVGTLASYVRLRRAKARSSGQGTPASPSTPP